MCAVSVRQVSIQLNLVGCGATCANQAPTRMQWGRTIVLIALQEGALVGAVTKLWRPHAKTAMQGRTQRETGWRHVRGVKTGPSLPLAKPPVLVAVQASTVTLVRPLAVIAILEST